MSIIIDNDTKLVVSGLTGREGSFHGLRNKAYGTQLVAGVTPGKGGQDVEGTPIYDTLKESVDEAGANTAMIFVPARFAADSINEAIDSGVDTVRTAPACSPRARPTSASSRLSSSIRDGSAWSPSRAP
jgi:succinyl-CoA synthetase alpha subunit